MVSSLGMGSWDANVRSRDRMAAHIAISCGGRYNMQDSITLAAVSGRRIWHYPTKKQPFLDMLDLIVLTFVYVEKLRGDRERATQHPCW
ncbi:hypothetical protein L210DRAFT_1035442 [Boletus edulis BED1]|uniref:Uncharacterized protein n=1 Tax=Boletus edulis BED1 TaxID=1328754 RepID=A0AAD4GF75_BOLED|nr:hypothetical protein L210DRAFT_1035442 [Boletus edulis BED1]